MRSSMPGSMLASQGVDGDHDDVRFPRPAPAVDRAAVDGAIRVVFPAADSVDRGAVAGGTARGHRHGRFVEPHASASRSDRRRSVDTDRRYRGRLRVDARAARQSRRRSIPSRRSGTWSTPLGRWSASIPTSARSCSNARTCRPTQARSRASCAAGVRLVFDGVLVRAGIAAAGVFLRRATRREGVLTAHEKTRLIIPCHRVVAAGNGPGGFMRGRDDHALSIKRWLLTHEGFL